MEKEHKLDEETNDSPIEEVRLVVPITDDPTLPVLTFRTWILGPITCAFLAFATELFVFQQTPFTLSSVCFQILVFPIGKLMELTLPTKPVRVLGTNWTFSMNPGPFNVKEHALVTLFANSGLDPPLALQIVSMAKVLFKMNISIWAALTLTLATQMLGYGFAGVFMDFLVNSPYMWWPYCLIDVSFYRALHDVELRPKGHLTKFQFFVIVSVASFSYYIVPNYFFPSISSLAFICWIWKDSVVAQIIGSGRYGLGIGSFGVDWVTISGFLGNPLGSPPSTTANSLVGVILFLCITVPIAYWSNLYHARRFPFSSYNLYDFDGQVYNVSRILNENDHTTNESGYNNYSKVYMSTVHLFSFGFKFAALSATVTHFVLFYARDAWLQFKESYKRKNDNFGDVHNRLMRRYDPIPKWWFYAILVFTISMAAANSEGFGKQLQLPFWGVLLGCLLVFILLLPVGVIEATTGQSLDLNVISELIFGYVAPGKPLANASFKIYGTVLMFQAKSFIYDFKMGHYMKIPPKSMFIAQVAGTFFSALLHLASVWWLLSTVENICDVKKLPKGSPWTCPGVHSFYSSTIVWGAVGPSRIFAPHGLYSRIYYLFLAGALGTLVAWLLSLYFPQKKWIKLVSFPVIFGAANTMPVSGAVNHWTWFMVAFFFNVYVFRKYKGWWAKYNYVLACGLDLGVAFSALLTSAALQFTKEVYGVDWWGFEVSDHCSLAQCPTASGVHVEGCPVF